MKQERKSLPKDPLQWKNFAEDTKTFIENTSEQDSNCEQNGKCLKELSELIRKIKRSLTGKKKKKQLCEKDGSSDRQPVPLFGSRACPDRPTQPLSLRKMRNHWRCLSYASGKRLCEEVWLLLCRNFFLNKEPFVYRDKLCLPQPVGYLFFSVAFL